MVRIRPDLIAAAVLCSGCLAWAQTGSRRNAPEHWVTTWATAESLTNAPFGGRGGGRGPVPAANAPVNAPAAPQANQPSAAPARGGRGRPNNSGLPPSFDDQTVRMVVHTSIGGRRIRVRFSNMTGAQPLEIGGAHIAKYKGDGAVVEGSDRALTFGGRPVVTIQSGIVVLSDPLDFEIAPLSDLAVSIYLPHDTGSPTNHTVGLHTAYISKGDVAGAVAMPEPTTMTAYAWLAAIDVVAPADAFTVVALGDSITDGYATTKDANQAWPTLLAERLNSSKGTEHIAVVNEGVSGNQVLRDGAGVSALARLERDVLGLSGVKWVILLEAINDINIRGRSDGPNAVTSDELIWGYQQIVARCHDHGIQVIGATVMPEEGVPTASERGEAIRQALNQWIRAKGNFDAVVDFDATVRDPAHPARIRPELDPGDHIHPNDSGNEAMAAAFDLHVFEN
jgi:lysophospholipase L1-like esterase